jgi:Flp pilus assembly CpaE family ATPase
MSDIANLLSKSALALAPEVADALQSGWTMSALRKLDAKEIATTYRIRLELLGAKHGAHAAQLAAATSELLANLSDAAIVYIASLDGPAEHRYLIFLSESQSQVIGCLKVVSKLGVTNERWEELWQSTV